MGQSIPSATDAELRTIFTHQMIVLPFSETSTGWGNGLTGIHQSSTETWEGITPCTRQSRRLTSLAEKDLCPGTKDNQKPHALGRGLPATWGRWSFPFPLLSSGETHLECCAQLWASQLKRDTEANPVKLHDDDDGTVPSNVKQETESQDFLAVKIYFI